MATAALVSASEYLSTSYRPDQEMLDGQLIERNVGEYDHSNLQGALVAWMRRRQREWNIRVLPEQRLKFPLPAFVFPMCVSFLESKSSNRFSLDRPCSVLKCFPETTRCGACRIASTTIGPLGSLIFGCWIQ